MKFLLVMVLVLDFIAIYRVISDEVYLLDNDKPKYIFWIIVIPIIGAIVAMRKIGYKWIFFLSEPSNLTTNNLHGNDDKLDFTYYVSTNTEIGDIGGADGG